MFRILVLVLVCGLARSCVSQITPNQAAQIVATFNKARASTLIPAADMRMVHWDQEVADLAQAYVEGCSNYFQEFYNPPSFFLYRDQGPDPVAVAQWRTLRMAPYYDLYTGLCKNTSKSRKICRHPENYEKVMFAENEGIGCGMAVCGAGRKNIFHACLARQADLQGISPAYAWEPGPRCSKCPNGFPYCLNGLCSRYPATTSPTKSPITRPPTRMPTRFPTRAPVNRTRRKKNRRRRRRGLSLQESQ